MALHVVRILFLLVVLGVTLSFAFGQEVIQRGSNFVTWYILVPALIAFSLVLADMLWRDKHLQTISGLFFGVLTGMIIAFFLSLVVDLVVGIFPSPPPAEPPIELAKPPPDASTVEQAAYQAAMRQYPERVEAYNAYVAHVRTVQLIKLLVGAATVFFCVSFVLQTKDVFRFVIPYVEFSKQAKGPAPLLLDTSVIIDGRIADIVETRIIESELVVPRFVLHELHTIADSSDKLKRNRGRRGLDVLNRLRSSEKVEIEILDASVPSVDTRDGVDAKLVALAEHLGGRIVTNDYNLNKVARLRDVEVININDLANSLKPVVLPGETMRLKVIKAGEEPGQGVGYLDDGTMVVVEGGRDHIGREIGITVTSALQTSAGKMIFGKVC